MDAETLDLIIRGRPTILEILEDRGYNVESYKGATADTLQKFATTNADLLKIQAEHENGMRVTVLYWVEGMVRLRLEGELNKFWAEENTDRYDPAKDEIIVILSEPFHDAFHLHAAKQWNLRKARVTFFQLKNLISNPARHSMVPPHRKLSPEEIQSVVSSLHIKSKNEFPHIKYHIDMQARVHGLVPGDVVEIRRPSETAGEYTSYRVCLI
jgi:DNA-directed RNA polymerase subunit H